MEKLSSSASFYILEAPGERDQLTTFPKLAIRLLNLIRTDHQTQWEGCWKNQKIMFYISLPSKRSHVHLSWSYPLPNKTYINTKKYLK